MQKGKFIIFSVTNDLNYDQRMQRIAGLLARNGYRVRLIGRKRKNSIALSEMPFEQKRLKCFFEKGKLFYLEYNLRLLIYLLTTQADAYGAVDFDTILPNSLVSKLKGKKLIFDAHEFFTEVPELANRQFTKAIWEKVGNFCIPKCDLAYTVGIKLAQLFSHHYKIKFYTVLNVPYHNLIQKKQIQQQNSPIILYQGALNEGRGLEQLIKAMQWVEAKLIIAGEGDLSKELRKLVFALQLNDKVDFLGFVKPVNLPELTAKATIGCNLLEPKGLSYQYSLANKFFDYIHAGVPQLCADFIEYKNINQQFEVAILCKCDTEMIVYNLNKLLNNKHLYAQLQDNCAKAAQVYNLQQEEYQLINMYQQLFS